MHRIGRVYPLLSSVLVALLVSAPAFADEPTSQPESEPAPAPTPTRPAETTKPPLDPAKNETTAWATGIGAGICVLGGTVLGISALAQSNAYASHATSARANAGEATALGADVLFGLAATLAVTSLVLFVRKAAPATAWLTGPVRF